LSYRVMSLLPIWKRFLRLCIQQKNTAFDFVSFKPCLVRLEDTHKESLLDSEDAEQEQELERAIKKMSGPG